MAELTIDYEDEHIFPGAYSPMTFRVSVDYDEGNVNGDDPILWDIQAIELPDRNVSDRWNRVARGSDIWTLLNWTINAVGPDRIERAIAEDMGSAWANPNEEHRLSGAQLGLR